MHISIASKSEKFLTRGEKRVISIDPSPAESELGAKAVPASASGAWCRKMFLRAASPGDLESNGYAHTVASSL